MTQPLPDPGNSEPSEWTVDLTDEELAEALSSVEMTIKDDSIAGEDAQS